MSDLEDTLMFQMLAINLPKPVRQFKFWEGRRFAFDFAWPEIKLAVETEGGVYTQGRHTRGRGVESDMVKYNEAAVLGWTVLRFSGDMVTDGVALQTIERMFAAVGA